MWSDGTYNYVWGAELITNGSVYYLYNAHGDVVQLLNSSGTVTKTYDYEAYGNELKRDAADTNPFRYCGEYYDTETGFIYLRARYYDPSVGRFISADPAKDGLNWYAYCNNNPVVLVDRNGLWPEWASKVAKAAAIVAVGAAVAAVTIATVGTAGAVIGAAASACLGVSASAATTAATAIGCASAVYVGMTSVSDAAEVFTGKNELCNAFFGGNRSQYILSKQAAYLTCGFFSFIGLSRLMQQDYYNNDGYSMRDQLLDTVSNQKLKNCIDQLYRPGAQIGDGGLADAIRHEICTGELVGGKSHILKGVERMRNLENILKSQELTKTDMKIAEFLLEDLKSALKSGGLL